MTREISSREIECCGTILKIEQNLGNEHGASVWDAALVLAKYFENENVFPKGFWKNKTYPNDYSCRILELGSGNGFIGIVLAMLGAKVIMTDLKILLPLIELNVKINCKDLLDDRLFIREVQWGRDIVDDHYDYILGCDCVYDNEGMWKEFATALQQHARKDVKIIIAYEYRSQVDLKFFDHIKDQFSVKKVDSEDMDPHWVGLEYVLIS